ncbi:hypothetical protein [uncultured Sphingomonas sp.]|uniref:CC0125/CC1285 family lipoprotein n=1 Tax=uncultured Sphingomonas sp. TaxID=158754 RepID=UPI0035CA4339
MRPGFGRKAVLAAIAASTFVVAGCATETTYRPAQGRGFYRTGFSEQRVEPDRFIVSFGGNSVTERDTVERYLLFRAAELTVQQGYDYFVTVERETDRQSRTYSTGFGYGGLGYGGFGYGGFSPYWNMYGRGFGYRRFGGGFGGFGGGFGGYGGFGGFGNDFDIRQVDRFEATAEIVLRRGPIPRDNLRAFDARRVIDTVGPSVVLPQDRRR